MLRIKRVQQPWVTMHPIPSRQAITYKLAVDVSIMKTPRAPRREMPNGRMLPSHRTESALSPPSCTARKQPSS